MKQSLSTLQKVKTVIHIVQAFSIFIAACITITVFTGPGHSDSRLKWFFTMVCTLQESLHPTAEAEAEAEADNPTLAVLSYYPSLDIPHSSANVDASRKHCKGSVVRVC
jgi:hypothetical protein